MHHAITENTGWRFLFSCILFLFVTLFLFPPQSLLAETTMEGMTIKVKEKGWTIDRVDVIPAPEIAQFELRYAVAIDTMYNQFIEINDNERNRAQINYVLCHSEQDAVYLLSQMVEIVGRQNVILQKNKLIVEVIATKPEIQKEVVIMLNVSNVQKRKLNCATLPKNWKLVREISMTESELQKFAQKMEVPVDEVVNQFFLINRARVQVNYIGCRSESDAAKVFTKLNAMTGKVNTILQKDTIVLEVISATAESKDEVLKKLEKI